MKIVTIGMFIAAWIGQTEANPGNSIQLLGEEVTYDYGGDVIAKGSLGNISDISWDIKLNSSENILNEMVSGSINYDSVYHVKTDTNGNYAYAAMTGDIPLGLNVTAVNPPNKPLCKCICNASARPSSAPLVTYILDATVPSLELESIIEENTFLPLSENSQREDFIIFTSIAASGTALFVVVYSLWWYCLYY